MRKILKVFAVIGAAVAVWTAAPDASLAQSRDQAKEMRSLVDAMINAAHDGEREEYARRLKAYPQDAVGDEWLARLESAWRPSSLVRIIESMAEFSDRRFVIPIARRLVDPHAPVRRSAALTLKRIGDDRLYPVILNMATSEVPVHRIYFVEAMTYLYDQRFYQSLALLMREDNKSVRIYVIKCFAQNRISESLGLIRSAAAGDRNDEVRIAAIDALGSFRDAGSVGLLNAALNDGNRDVRCAAVAAIGLIGSAMSVAPLSARLAVEEDVEIKERITATLAGMRRVGDTRGLERILSSDKSPGLRVRAAYLLGFSGSAQAFAALARGTDDADYRVRAEACNSLGNFRTKQSLEVLFAVMERNEPVYVKSAALYAVKRINDRSSLVHLFDLYARERDPLFSELLRESIREMIKRYV